MSVPKGFMTLIGAKKATTWGTAVACGSGDGVEITAESVTPAVALVPDLQITGSAHSLPGDLGNKLIAGDIVTAARYEGLEVLAALGFGTAGAPTTVDTTAKLHKLKLANQLDGILATLAMQKGFEVHEFTTIKVVGISFKCAQGGRAEITFKLIAHDVNLNTSTGTNNNTTISSVTLPANREFLQFRQLTVRVNAQSGGALAGSDAIYVSEISLDIDRSMKADDVTTRFGNKVDEPLQNDFSKITGNLVFSKYMNDSPGGNAALYAATLAKTAQKMDWTFVADSLAGSVTQKFQWAFLFPNLKFTEGAPVVGGAGLLGWQVGFEAFRCTAAPTGMTGVTEPVELQIHSQRSTDPLA